MTALPLISDVRPVPVPPRCSHYEGGVRCQADATVRIISPDHRAITADCAEHAAAVLAEYAGVPELSGWYSVPLEVQP